ncbi:hypothetical protein E3C22_24110 [Jiella endophytica]|uniref:Uncharacterized protein n=1 Tax=Jiella endophytica TaxID=2558362 RepID=A0A4Y8R814_9HYPH|nr:hypothetical protein [Jiella endophytica]TFF17219.1 hypothetical protein E3C22_24110 [Jiella endophytica]
MLDGIFRLLKLEMKLVFALLGFALRATTWIVRGASRLIARQSQLNRDSQSPAPRQQPLPSSATAPTRARRAAAAAVAQPVPATAAEASGAVPPPPPPQQAVAMASPRPVAPPRPAAVLPSAAHVLAHPDHAIYVTTGSQLMVRHPFGDELLDRLDHILMVAAHRDGDPFQIPPQLDDSAVADTPAPAMPPPFDDGGFDPVEPQPLPPADAALWCARPGKPFIKLVQPTPPPIMPESQKADDELELMLPLPDLFDDEAFDRVTPRPLPPADGALWQARLGSGFQPVAP